MGYAARVMRGLIIDHARSRNAIKRGGEFEITSLKTDVGENPVDAKELSEISDALDQLAKVEPKLAARMGNQTSCQAKGLNGSELDRTLSWKFDNSKKAFPFPAGIAPRIALLFRSVKAKVVASRSNRLSCLSVFVNDPSVG
jgi:hypothetical protein